eukprot:1226151-Pyramimonas_sp.AAC.1
MYSPDPQIEAGLLQFYGCNVKHMRTSELESTTSVPIRALYSTVALVMSYRRRVLQRDIGGLV